MVQKLVTIAANQEVIASNSTNYVTSPPKYDSPEAQETYEETAGSRSKIEGYDNDLAELNEQYNAADDKGKEKIQKKNYPTIVQSLQDHQQ